MKGRTHWWVLGALLGAVVVGFSMRLIVGAFEEGSVVTHGAGGFLGVCSFVGDIFKQALQMLIVPLIVSSVIAGIASLHGLDGFARLGLKTALFYGVSSLLAIFLGLLLVNTLKPGLEGGKPNKTIREAFSQQEAKASDADKERIGGASSKKASDVWDIFKRMFPPNIFHAATSNGQMLGVIVFSLLFAVALTRLPPIEMKTLREFFQAFNDVMILLTRWVMWTAPIGIFALILPLVYSTGLTLFAKLGLYFVTVLSALAIHALVILPLLLIFLARIKPWKHFRAMRLPLLTAFSTSSSSATLPITLRAAQEESGVSKRTASFTLPLGATVNMDGTALYECVAVIFVAQVMDIEMGFGAQFMVVVAALLTSVGVAGIPSASLVAILLILKNSNIPNAEVAAFTLLAVDRPLDMCRTAVNVLGDSCAAVIVARSEGEEIYIEKPAPDV